MGGERGFEAASWLRSAVVVVVVVEESAEVDDEKTKKRNPIATRDARM